MAKASRRRVCRLRSPLAQPDRNIKHSTPSRSFPAVFPAAPRHRLAGASPYVTLPSVVTAASARPRLARLGPAVVAHPPRQPGPAALASVVDPANSPRFSRGPPRRSPARRLQPRSNSLFPPSKSKCSYSARMGALSMLSPSCWVGRQRCSVSRATRASVGVGSRAGGGPRLAGRASC